MDIVALSQSEQLTLKTTAMIALAISITIFGVGSFYAHGSSQLTWGTVATGKIIAISYYPHGTVYTVTMGKANGMITTIGPCGNLSVGDSIFYQMSSVDPDIGTQRFRLVSPSNCVTGINGWWT